MAFFPTKKSKNLFFWQNEKLKFRPKHQVTNFFGVCAISKTLFPNSSIFWYTWCFFFACKFWNFPANLTLRPTKMKFFGANIWLFQAELVLHTSFFCPRTMFFTAGVWSTIVKVVVVWHRDFDREYEGNVSFYFEPEIQFLLTLTWTKVRSPVCVCQCVSI